RRRFSGAAIDAFASRLAPTGDRISTVGASLLAKGPVQRVHHSLTLMYSLAQRMYSSGWV
ncbi:hypothetical protein DCO47_21420, partial [Pseudomonas sp. NDM]